jgi:hypothetical protein
MSPESHRRKFMKVATLSMKLGQFGQALKCLDAVNDYPGMLYLCLLTKSTTATQHLLSRLKKESSQQFESLIRLVQMQLATMTGNKRVSVGNRERADSTGSNASAMDYGTPPDVQSMTDSFSDLPGHEIGSLPGSSSRPSWSPPVAPRNVPQSAPPARTPPPPPLVVNLDETGSMVGSYDDDDDVPPPPPPEDDFEESSGSAKSTSSILESPVFEPSPLVQQSSQEMLLKMATKPPRIVTGPATTSSHSKKHSDTVQDLVLVSDRQKAHWRLELETRVSCEMKTLPLQRGSGNHVIGPLLINRLLSDWFARQVSFFHMYVIIKQSVLSCSCCDILSNSYLFFVVVVVKPCGPSQR